MTVCIYVMTVQLKWTVEPSSELRAPVGKPLHVPCLAEGNPQPRIYWTRLNSSNNTSGNDNTNNNNYNDGREDLAGSLGSELRFSPTISPDDAGLYECRASNGVEEDLVARVKLEVLGKYRDSGNEDISSRSAKQVYYAKWCTYFDSLSCLSNKITHSTAIMAACISVFWGVDIEGRTRRTAL